ERDRVVIVKGKISAKDRDGNITTDLKILVDDAREVTPEQAAAYETTGRTKKTPKPSKKTVQMVKMATTKTPENARLYVRMEDSEDTETLMKLKSKIDESNGETEVVLVVGKEDNKQIIRLPMRVDIETV